MQYKAEAVIASVLVVAMLSAFGTLSAFANPSPTGSGMGCTNSAKANTNPALGTCTGGGQPGAGPQTQPARSPNVGGSASATTCQGVATATGQALSAVTPGNSGNSQSAHGTGTGNQHYAGQPNTPSAANSNSQNAVSQYDTSCYQQAVH